MLFAHGDDGEAGELALPPLTGHRLLTAWEVDPWFVAAIAVVTVLYAAGLALAHRRGVHWPAARTAAFAGGIGVLVIAGMSSLAVYDDTLFTAHMVQHMLLAMVAPVFLALGAPVTLALRVLPAGPRGAVVALVHSRLARLLTWPPVAWVHFVALPFALYSTGWYEATLRSDFLHEWLHVQFVVAGCLFFWPILGLDPMPRRLGYPARMLMTFLALPAHAILGLSIMMSSTLIAGDYYRELGRDWGPTLAGDQGMGGGVIWASGDLVGLLFFGVLFWQWQRADGRTARREDRAADRDPRLSGNTHPWWEDEPGPLAERMRRQGWVAETRAGGGD